MRKPRSTLTFPQLVLEVRVTPSFPVKIETVTDEQGPAHARGDRAALPAHHNRPFGLVSGEFRAVFSFFVGCSGLSAASLSGSDPEGPGRTPLGEQPIKVPE